MPIITYKFKLYFLDIKASWEEWWTYDGISGPGKLERRENLITQLQID